MVAWAIAAAVLAGTAACGPGTDPEPANPLAGSTLWVDPQSAAALAEQQLRSDGDPTTAMRISGPMRSATMSFVTCSPRRTPAS